jgi:hypothetical protein
VNKALTLIMTSIALSMHLIVKTLDEAIESQSCCYSRLTIYRIISPALLGKRVTKYFLKHLDDSFWL